MAAPLRLLGALAVGVVAATPLAAQHTTPSTYAITNARLVPVSGAAIARGTIVVRNGLIAAIGANVAVPADARVIDGAGLTVYRHVQGAEVAAGMAEGGASPSW